MRNRPLAFISYAQVDNEFVYENIIPVLKELDIDIWVAGEQIKPGFSITETIVEGIKNADLVICLFNRRSTFVNLEIGAAIGNGKPILAIVNDTYNEFYADIRHLNYLRWSDNNLQEFPFLLKKTIEILTENVIDTGTFAFNKDKKIIGISVGSDNGDFQQELLFTSEFIDFIKQATNSPEIGLIQTTKGCLKSLISLDLKSWAELLEKIIFIIPELKKRKAERLKIGAEVEKIKAETNSINVETNIKQAEAFVDLIEKYQKLGISIQIDRELLITQNQNGQLTFKQPNQLD